MRVSEEALDDSHSLHRADLVVYVLKTGQRRVFREAFTRYAPHKGGDWRNHPAWSPDGRRVAVVDVPEGLLRPELVVLDAATGQKVLAVAATGTGVKPWGASPSRPQGRGAVSSRVTHAT